jgi:hypothetical protein
MNVSKYLTGYKSEDVENLYITGSITPKFDSYGNLIIQNIQGELYSSSISIPFQNVVYNPTKVETKNSVAFQEL